MGDRSLTYGGSNWLWVVTAVLLLSFFIFAGLGLFKPLHGERIFHYLFTIGLFTGAVAYYAMASNLGWSLIPTHLNRDEAGTYTVFFAKYIYWVVSFPVASIALGLASGVSWATIVYNVFLCWAWIISYLVGAYTATRYKWGFFTLGTLAYLLLAFSTIFTGLSASRRFTLSRDYTILTGYLNLLWFLYPIGWAITDGGNVIGVSQMAIYFGILDLLLLPGLAFGFLWFSRKWDYGLMNLHFTQFGRVPQGAGTFPEKTTRAPVAGGVAREAPTATPAGPPAAAQPVNNSAV
ncbi:bacteriorhodopsin-like protein [Sarocladium implicatum]|nr:bacteriorhodopsin-like protein [Sarocladium implicatum]